MSGSLNEGLELDNEIPIVSPVEPNDIFTPESIVPGEVPELKGDVEQLIALENALQDLIYLAQDLQKTQGMNQTFALEAERLLPGFGNGTPLGFYSKDLSATRYKVALEEITTGIWALIAAAIVAIIAAIVKFISWFRGGKSKDEGSVEYAFEAIQKAEEKAEEHQEKLEESEEVVANVKDVIQHGELVVLDKDGKEIGSVKKITMRSLVDDLLLDTARYEQAKQFLANKDPIFADIIKRGPYTQAIRQVGSILPGINGHLKLKLKMLEEISHADLDDGISNLAKDQAHRALDVISQPVIVQFMHRDSSLMDVGSNIGNLRQQTAERTSGGEMDLDRMVAAVIDSYRSADIIKIYGELRDTVEIFADLEKRLETLKTKLGNLSDDGEPGHNSEGVAAHLRQVIFSLAKDVNGYRQVVAEVKNYISFLDHLAVETEGFSLEVEKQLLHLIKKGNFRVPDSMEHQIQQMQEKSSKTIWSLLGKKKK